MTVAEHAAKLRTGALDAAAFKTLKLHTGLEESALFDALAKEIAERFSDGSWSFEDSDTAINNLHAFHMTNGTSPPPPFFHGVFLAFDDGEHDHGGRTKGADPVELYTKPAIARILGAK